MSIRNSANWDREKDVLKGGGKLDSRPLLIAIFLVIILSIIAMMGVYFEIW